MSTPVTLPEGWNLERNEKGWIVVDDDGDMVAYGPRYEMLTKELSKALRLRKEWITFQLMTATLRTEIES
mgnify:CR=1 FL=1